VNTPTDLVDVPDLQRHLDALLRQVPRGRVTTYGELARALGDVRAARWVGESLLNHPHNDRCGCHRVVRSTGEVGLYVTGDAAEKAARLVRDGITVEDQRVNLTSAMRAGEFDSPAPLRRLVDFQQSVRRRLQLTPLRREPGLLCGLDVAYLPDGTASGAAVLIDAATLETVGEESGRMPAAFPYIPGYLAFRELPLMMMIWRLAAAHASRGVVCFVDGNGMLHPRRAGVASCFGVLADVPTIGIGKSLLCGRVEPSGPSAAEAPPVVDQGEIVARSLKSRDSSRPIYVSVGNRLTLEDAVRLTRRCLTEHRLPEPIHRADRLSKRNAVSGQQRVCSIRSADR
jgi:deoxyribonuclease V